MHGMESSVHPEVLAAQGLHRLARERDLLR